MRKMLMRTADLAILTILVIAGFSDDVAAAKVRVAASLSVPGAGVVISSTSCGRCGSVRCGNVAVRRYPYYRIGGRDLGIASRLAAFTGVPAGRIISIRRQGRSWFAIGRMLCIPRPVVRAALSSRSWTQFVRNERMHARRNGRCRNGEYRVCGYTR
jgi:hypothetical protein